MQNKGIIKLFAILFGLVSIYQLSFTFIANSVEDDAEAFAAQRISSDVEDYHALREIEQTRYLDSIGNNEIISGITYNTAKDKELNKGLDLKGGINVILQISVKDILRELANNSKDPAFSKALAGADELQKTSQDDYVDLFFEAFEEIPDARLASPDIFANKNLSDDITYDMTNAQVKPVIRKRIDESITSAFEVLRKRIDKFGVTQPNIQRLGNSGRILVELPGAKDIERVTGLLQSTAQLEFWHVFKGQELAPFISQADSRLREILKPTEETTKASDST
ncbi:MAG: protein translocase subunit SecDF, partial [Mesonia sp.]